MTYESRKTFCNIGGGNVRHVTKVTQVGTVGTVSQWASVSVSGQPDPFRVIGDSQMASRTDLLVEHYTQVPYTWQAAKILNKCCISVSPTDLNDMSHNVFISPITTLCLCVCLLFSAVCVGLCRTYVCRRQGTDGTQLSRPELLTEILIHLPSVQRNAHFWYF